MKLKIKKGDTVEMVAGADKGKQGQVLQINKDDLKVTVSGVRMQTHFDKENGLEKKEGFVHYSNLKLVEKASQQKKKKTTKKKKAKKTASA